MEAPPNVTLLQGVETGTTGLSYNIPFSIPADFEQLPYVTLSTPYGPINVRFKKLKELRDRHA